jgi:hypothetical protein
MIDEVNENTQETVNPLLAPVKLALRVTTTAFDSEITDLIEAAKLDMNVAGVVLPSELNTLVGQAVITYVKMNFGDPDNYDRLKRSYDEQKAQLVTCTGYTNWLGADNGQV